MDDTRNKIHKGNKARRYPADLDTLKTFITYDPDEGRFVWLGAYNVRPRPNKSGYNVLKLPHEVTATARGNRETAYYRCDHLAWFYMTGEWPSGWIEHLNGLSTDDTIENLIHLDKDGARWWYGAQVGMTLRKLVRVEDSQTYNGAVAEVYHMPVAFDEEGNEKEIVTTVKPRVADGWVQRAVDNAAKPEDTIEPMDALAKGEFGVDWG